MIKRHEMGRKVIHLGSAIFPISYWFIDKQIFLPVIAALAVGTVLVDFGRQKVPLIARAFNAVFGLLLREEEQTKLTGGSTVMIAQLMMVAFFPKPIAIAGLLTLSIGDTAAALVGLSFGKIKVYKEKTLEGAVAFLVSAGVVISLVPGIPVHAAILAAAAGALVEIFLNDVDDNLFVPLASGLALILLLGV